MREKEDFRNNLQRIDERFPNKEMLTLSDVAKFTGIDRKKIGKDWQDIFTPVGKSKYVMQFFIICDIDCVLRYVLLALAYINVNIKMRALLLCLIGNRKRRKDN